MEAIELSKIVAGDLAQLGPEDIRPWLAGFVSTHPKELVQAVNLMVKDDERYKDAVHRMHSWVASDPKALVSWSHVSPDTETSLRMAASWASCPWTDRNQYERYPLEWHARAEYKGSLGLPRQAAQAREASSRWNDRVFLNRNGVALAAWTSTEPWADEVGDLVAAIKCPRDYWIVLCLDGIIIEGLRTWPRT